MKKLLLTFSALLLVGGTILFLTRRAPQRAVGTGPETMETDRTVSSQAAPAEHVPEGKPRVTAPSRRGSASAEPVSQPAPAAVTPASGPSLPFQQALGTLVSGQSTFGQKQAAWQQVKDAGQLDQVITELEKQSASNSSAAEYPATLGQAYLQKAGTIKDLREQGILGLKADESFEAALNLDPANWEAGFWKAAAMSYWPPQLGKGKEVIERFVELIKLQEVQAPQPQFVQTYVMLGEQYQKQGYPDYARQIWQRGVTLFPSDQRLAEKLSQPQPQPEQAAAR